MTKQGYFIARNRKADEFFTSSSAYDRPQWKAADKATAYRDIHLAESALKKLLVNGAYEARIVPVEEAISFEMPDDKKEVTLPNDQERQELDATGGDADDLSTEPPDDADQLVSDEDDPEEEMNTDIQSKVDSKLDGQGDDDGDDSNVDHEDQPGENGEVDQDTEDLAAALDADASVPNQEASPGKEDELRDEPVVQPTVRESAMALPMTSIPVVAFKNDTTDQSAGTTGPMDNQEKIKTPAKVMSDLRAVIADFKKQAEFTNTRDDARGTFCLTVVAALEELEQLLSVGTVDSMKMAQIKFTSWMNPITVHVPVSVQKFIYMGGRKPNLKDLFDDRRAAKKL